VRRKRNGVQDRLARQLAELAGALAVDFGGTQQVLVCVTKADLVRLALEDGRSLRDIGRDPDARVRPVDEPGDVVRGAARYLLEVAKRWSTARLTVSPGAAAVVERITLDQYDDKTRTAAALQVAGALVEHYDDPAALWDLVHLGGADTISIPPGSPSAVLQPGVIQVPSLDRHLVESLVVGQGLVMHVRDLVMSALTCGIAYGLGFGEQIQRMLSQEWRELRFFLCSPLGQVPVPTAADAVFFEPMGKGHFTDLTARSSALSQLLLCVLGRLRP
jgi:hypothetical protein